MKIFTTFTWILFFLATACGLRERVSDRVYYERLYYTCKVWGFIKYFHSSMESKDMDWDDILLETLDDIKTAPDNLSFNKALLVMINKAGDMKSNPNTLPDIPDSLNLNDFNWFKDPVFSSSVKARLKNIKTLFRPHFNRYVRSLVPSNPLLTGIQPIILEVFTLMKGKGPWHCSGTGISFNTSTLIKGSWTGIGMLP